MNRPISFNDLCAKVGIPPGTQASVQEIAEKIGFTKRPISLSELATAVDEFEKQQGKKE